MNFWSHTCYLSQGNIIKIIKAIKMRSRWELVCQNSTLNPVVYWANFCLVNLVRIFGELRRRYVRGSRSFANHALGIFAQFGKPCLWLIEKKENSPVDEEERRKKWMTVSIFHSLRRELTCLLTCGRRSLVSGTQNEIVVSWMTLWGMNKVDCLSLIWH